MLFFEENMKSQSLKKILYIALTLNIILALIIFAVIILNVLNRDSNVIKNNITFLLILIGIAFTVNIYILIRSTKMNLILISKYDGLEKSITQLEKLNNTLRAQRHDFLNHLQIVYGLIELDEFIEVGKYIKDIYGDIQNVSKFLKTSQPAINALLQAKTASAEKNDIEVELDIKSKLDLLPMDPWEVSRVISNLIDNAIDSLMDLEKNRKLYISIHERIDKYTIVITDNGPKIPENIKNRIFEPGFSTKAKDEKGMGLAIVNNIVDDFKGTIRFDSSDAVTRFIIQIPKKAKSVI